MKKLLLALALFAFALPLSLVSAQEKTAADPKAEALRKLIEKFSPKVVTLTWITKTSMMGQEMETTSSATGVIVGDKGLVTVSNQPFMAGSLASMFGGRRGGGGGGSSSGPEDFKVRGSDGKEVEALAATTDSETNLRFYAGRYEEGKAPAALALPEKASVPALGEEVVIIGAYDGTLNYARFFKTARINSVIEEGKYYGLDGSINDCLGGLVVTYSGNVLGVVAQKAAQDATGGIGGMLGGLSDPAKMLGNRILMTPATFAGALKKAQEKVSSADFGKAAPKPEPKPEEKPEPKPEPKPEEKPPVEEKKHNWRGITRVISVDEKVLKGKYGEVKGGIMISAKPDEASMAGKAGVANGDIVIKIGDTALAADTTVDKFWELIEKQDGTVKLTVVRFGGKEYELTIHTK